jgi:hypothetical protein
MAGRRTYAFNGAPGIQMKFIRRHLIDGPAIETGTEINISSPQQVAAHLFGVCFCAASAPLVNTGGRARLQSISYVDRNVTPRNTEYCLENAPSGTIFASDQRQLILAAKNIGATLRVVWSNCHTAAWDSTQQLLWTVVKTAVSSRRFIKIGSLVDEADGYSLWLFAVSLANVRKRRAFVFNSRQTHETNESLHEPIHSTAFLSAGQTNREQ